jgi:hypothetical protein
MAAVKEQRNNERERAGTSEKVERSRRSCSFTLVLARYQRRWLPGLQK